LLKRAILEAKAALEKKHYDSIDTGLCALAEASVIAGNNGDAMKYMNNLKNSSSEIDKVFRVAEAFEKAGDSNGAHTILEGLKQASAKFLPTHDRKYWMRLQAKRHQ